MARKLLSSRSRLFGAIAAFSGALALVLPAVADGIKAGEAITNKATATYDDGTTNYNATSNTVEIKVAEVAGINAAAGTPTVPSIVSGGESEVTFTITNTGNDATQFVIPMPKLTNITDFEIVGTPTIVTANGVAKNVPLQPGVATGTYLGADGAIQIYPGSGAVGTVTVTVKIKARPGATLNATTLVSLGDTANATPSVLANAQDVPQRGVIADDLRTEDNAVGAPGESAIVGAPVNGIREAMATTTTPITIGVRPQAFATILESVSDYRNNSTPSPFTDDKLTFAITLKNPDPTIIPAGLTPADLAPTSIDLNGSKQDRILISNAIPAGTTLSNVNPTPAPGWNVVYTLADRDTINALDAVWTETRPTTGVITRIGYVKTGKVVRNSTLPGFSFEVTPNATFVGGPIASIAEVFGQSALGPVASGTPTQIVYDQSGDNVSNNGLDGTDPNPVTNPTVGAPGITVGKADSNDPDPTGGIDPDPTKKNTGTTPGGESTVFTIAGGILNGPNGAPTATGSPGNTNDDFTNKSLVLPPGADPTRQLTDPETLPVTFTNTLRNDSPAIQVIALVPTPPAIPGMIPPGTTVTIDPDGAGPGAPVVFTYDGAVYKLPVAAVPPTVTVPGNGTTNYTVEVNLPIVDQLKEFPFIITAFIDSDGDKLADTDEPMNQTIDRIYSGYLSLDKKARILDGATEIVGFTADANLLSPALRPGRIIEYQITYKNLSSAATGSVGSVALPAKNLTITEDGAAPPNTWFATTKDPVGTTNPGSAADTTGGVLTTVVNGTDIQTYVDKPPTVEPGTSGIFTFRRQVK
jgi:hypothetical protein